MRLLLSLFFALGNFFSIAQEVQKADTLFANQYVEKAQVLQDSARYDSSIYYFKAASLIYEKADNWERWVETYNGIGENYRELYNYEKALSYLRKALEKGLKYLDKDNPWISDTYVKMGIIYAGLGNYFKATEYYQKALEVYLRVYGIEHTKIATVYMNMGIVHHDKGNYDKALEYYQKALKIDLKILESGHPSIASSYMSIGLVYEDQGNYDKTLEYYQRALKIYLNKYGNKHIKVATAYGYIGIVYNKLGNYPKTLDYYQKALEVKLKTYKSNHPSIAITYHNIGITYYELGDYQKALKYYQEVLRINSKVYSKEHPRVASTYIGVGNVYNSKNDYTKATEYYQKALEIYLKIYGNKHPLIATIYHNMGSVNRSMQAIEYYKKALSIRLNLYGKEHPLVANTLINMGIVYKNLNDYGKALEYYQRALRINLKIYGNEHPKIALSYENIGSVYRDQGRYTKALEYYQRALDIKQKAYNKDNSNIANIYRSIGLVYNDQKDYKKALKYYQSSIIALVKNFNDSSFYKNSPLEEIKSKPYLLKAFISKSLTLKELYYNQSHNLKDLQFSLETYQLAADLLDSMRSDHTSTQTKQELTEKNISSVYEGAISTACELYQVTKDPSYFHQAFTASERSKAYLLREALNEYKAKQFAGIPDSLIEHENELKIKIAFYEKSLFDAKNTGVDKQIDTLKVQSYQSTLFDLKRQYENLVVTLEKDYPEYYQIKYETKVASVEDIRENLLGDRSAFIEYFTGDSVFYVFSLTKEKIKLHAIEDLAEIQKSTQELRTTFTPSTSKFDRTSYKKFTKNSFFLYQKLLATVLYSLETKPNKLIIASDGIISYLPFELLLYKEAPLAKSEKEINYAHLPYLLNQYQVSYTYSATLIQQNKKNPLRVSKKDRDIKNECLALAPAYGEKSTSFAIRGNFDLLRNEELKLLPGAKKEAQNISKYFNGKFLFDTEANEVNFKREATKYSIIHLATHAEVEDKDPLYSKIYFTNTNDSIEDDTLHTYELYNMKLNADLVVLSGCATGSGEYIKGEGVISLSRGFMYAGTPSVVLSLWQVSDEHTSSLMDYFYKALSEGLAKDEALQKAKKQYLKKADVFTSHPYYWASFILHGDEKPITLSRKINLWWWLVGVALILLLGLVIAKRKNLL